MFNLGFIGIGNMGLPMVKNLRQAGFEVAVYDLCTPALKAAAEMGAVVCDSPRAVADLAQVVLSCVTNPAAVRQIIEGPNGVLRGRALAYYIEHATIGPDCAKTCADLLAQKGIAYLDAPLTGGVEGAEGGTLTVITSGKAQVLADLQPVLAPLGAHILHVSDQPGDAQVMKLATNMITVSNVAIASEAVLFAVKSGISAEKALDVLNKGMAGGVATKRFLADNVLDRTFASGCSLEILHKDVALGLEAAARADMPMFMASTAKIYLDRAMAKGLGGRDISEMTCEVEAIAGAKIAR